MKIDKEELRKKPTLCQGQADDLKIESEGIRIWLSRVDNKVAIEQLIDGKWTTITEDI